MPWNPLPQRAWLVRSELNAGDGRSPSLREKSTEKVQNISGQQFAQTLRIQGSTEVPYLFSVVFCTEPYGHHENMHTDTPFSVLQHGFLSSLGPVRELFEAAGITNLVIR